MTKSDFKKECYTTIYKGNRIKINAIFFDWKQNNNKESFQGYKYMVKSNVLNCSKKELFDIMYNWVNNEVQPPYYVLYKYAITDKERFKIPLIG
jgi:hypothetical protein